MSNDNNLVSYPRPLFVRKNTRLLDGVWLYENQGEHGKLSVPSLPFEDMLQINYQKEFEISQEESNGSVILNFLGVFGQANIYVNDNQVATHSGGMGFFNMDITPFITVGQNRLVVAIVSQEQGRIGIWQPVWLEFTSKSYIINVRVTPIAHQNSMIIQGRLTGQGGILTVDVFEGKTKTCSYKYTAKNAFILSVPLNKPITLWQPLNPKIYDIRIGYQDDNGNTLDTVATYTAYRNVLLQDGALRINDVPVFLKAAVMNSLQDNTPPAYKKAFTNLISMGFNAVIAREYPLASIFKYYADRLGFLLIDTNPLNMVEDWNYVVNNGFGNPSVVLWQPLVGFNGDGEVYKHMYYHTKEMDMSRPILSDTGKIYQCDVASFYLGENSVDELMTFIYEGRDIKQRTKDEKRQRKAEPLLLTSNEVTQLPKLITFSLGEIARDIRGQKEFVEAFTKMTKLIASQKTVGYIFDCFNDTQTGSNGLCDKNGDIKISKSTKNMLFLANC